MGINAEKSKITRFMFYGFNLKIYLSVMVSLLFPLKRPTAKPNRKSRYDLTVGKLQC